VDKQEDKSLLINFSLVAVALIALTVIIVFLARDIGQKDPEYNPVRTVLTEENIQPVAGVYTGDESAAAMQVVVAESAPAQAAFDGSLDGEMIYNNVCSACHTAAILGAPKPGSPEIAQRAEQGMDVLLQNAMNGLNAMPARGGRPDLSDEQMQAVVEFMLK
jgi:cytochrome c5